MKNRSSLLILLFALCTFSAFSVPQLNSFPSASSTIYLDFDGQLVTGTAWNSGGGPINAAPSGHTDAEITQMFKRISEDFRPFSVNVTTDEARYLAAPIAKRIRVIITPTNYFRPGVGGIAYTGSFTWGDDTPVFVFSNMLGNIKYIAEACTHETGHSLGLSHQSKYDNGCVIVQSYNEGIGTGQTSWAPVMGNSYYRNVTNWNNGPTPSGCTAAQDNLSIITANNFDYRPDDHTDNISTNPTSIPVVNKIFNATGIITTASDKDYFTINISAASTIHLDVTPFNIGGNDGANLDVKVVLLNSAKQVINTYDPLSIINVSFDSVLNAGTYYLMVDGAGNANVGDYGSLGEYTIAGTLQQLTVAPIKSVALSGTSVRDNHNLKWNIVSDEPVKTVVVEVSSNGTAFGNLTIIAPFQTNYGYNPFENKDLYYRLKVTSSTNQVAYSNIIMLRGTGKANKFEVSTLVHDQLKVNAPAKYDYALIDVNGRILTRGKGSVGVNTESTSALPSGMYILQINSNGILTTERIIKQ